MSIITPIKKDEKLTVHYSEYIRTEIRPTAKAFNTRRMAYPLCLEDEKRVREALRQMTMDASYNTAPSYTLTNATYPEGRIPFVDKHMRYLNANPKLDARMYIANLRLMTRISH